jgi:[histone H3]-lysine36 N-dimethyltransferase SETMAR
MASIEHRAVIKFLTKLDKKPKEIYEQMNIVYGSDICSYQTIKYWAKEFKLGREILDEERAAKPKTSTSDEMVKAVFNIVTEDRRISIEKISHILGISYGSVHSILHEDLHLSKLSSRWVPKMLRFHEKQKRIDCASANLKIYKDNPENFEFRLVTGDETWVHHFEPESKQQSMEWTEVGQKPPIKFKAQKSARKVLASIFWDSQGIIMIDFLRGGRTITGEYYATLMEKLRISIREKRRGKLSKGVIILHDNAPAHTSKIAVEKINALKFTTLAHPPYSPDLAPSDYYLFPKLKEFLRGQHFDEDEVVENAVQNWFSEQPEEFYLKGIRKLQKRYEKCILVKGDYVE